MLLDSAQQSPESRESSAGLSAAGVVDALIKSRRVCFTKMSQFRARDAWLNVRCVDCALPVICRKSHAASSVAVLLLAEAAGAMREYICKAIISSHGPWLTSMPVAPS